jgi:hypothetical protein
MYRQTKRSGMWCPQGRCDPETEHKRIVNTQGLSRQGDIKYGNVMTKNHHIFGGRTVMNKGCNESRNVLIRDSKECYNQEM